MYKIYKLIRCFNIQDVTFLFTIKNRSTDAYVFRLLQIGNMKTCENIFKKIICFLSYSYYSAHAAAGY